MGRWGSDISTSTLSKIFFLGLMDVSMSSEIITVSVFSIFCVLIGISSISGCLEVLTSSFCSSTAGSLAIETTSCFSSFCSTCCGFCRL